MVMSRRVFSVALAASLALSALAVGGGPAASAPQPTPLSALTTNANGEYHPLTPDRIFDTRRGIGTAAGSKPITTNGASFDVTVLGRGGVPADLSQVFAVVANITVARPTVQGYLLAYPRGESRPEASNISFRAGQVVPNTALLRPGTDGQVRVVLQGIAPGEAHVIVDVFGWISTSQVTTRGARLRTVNPGRLYDSRNEVPLSAGEARPVQVRGRSTAAFTIPNSTNVVGVVVNVTGINNRPTSVPTFISVLPTAPSGVPTTSNLNLTAGLTRANLAIVPVGPDGRIYVYNDQGQANVTLDVVGYLETNVVAARAGRIIPMRSPFRAIDTRRPPTGPLKLSAGQAEPWDFTALINSTSVGGVPIGNVTSFVGNLTGTGFERQYYNSPLTTYLSMTPWTAGQPSVSNLSFGIDEAVANLAVSRLGTDRRLWVYNAEGLVHYLFDISAMVLAD